jgi:hypothetical protein
MTPPGSQPPGTVGGYDGDNEVADRAAIHALLVAYGETLDRRDFDGFADLFGDDGVFMIGDREASGPEAADFMRETYRVGKNVARTPNFHLFFNEVVHFDGPGRALATSMCVYMVTDDVFPVPGPSGRYADELAKKDGRWYFARRRIVRIDNAPPRIG